jgi:uncharacterized protein involved in outer membrane biogenesis
MALKFFKYAGLLLGGLLVIFIGLSLFVNLYLTDERAERILLPRLQENLGRQVAMESLQVSLLRGIRINNFTVKEEDGITDFFRADEFVLSYELLPLFRKRLIISVARLHQPSIRVERDPQGRFNFETLAFLEKEPDTEPRREEELLVLPLALTIEQIAITRARIVVEDQMREFPGLEGLVNASFSVGTDRLDNLVYHGRYDFTADIHTEQARPHLAGQGEISPETITYRIEGAVDGQRLQLAGAVHNWRENPEVQLDLSSERLEVDQLLALVGSLSPETDAPGETAAALSGPAPPAGALPVAGRENSPPENQAAADGSPPPSGLTAAGRINIARVLVRNLEMRDLTASYTFEQGQLRISELNTRVADGLIAGNGRLDLNQPEPAFQGALRMVSLQAGQVATLLSEQFGDWLTGTLSSTFEFSGQGSEWQQISPLLTAAGEFTARDGRLREFPVTAAVAELLDLPELRAIAYETLRGTLRVEKGQVLLNSVFSARDLRIEAGGAIGLDGQMNVPVSLHFLGPLAEKIERQAPLARYLTRADDGITINIRLTGPVTGPRTSLDTAAVGEQLREEVEKKIQKEVEKFLEPGEDRLPPPARDLLDELLRRN